MPEAPHRRLAAVLESRIADGAYPYGSRFPTIRAIAAEHGVGVGTAYQAVALLRAAGRLTGEPRRRLTVAHPVAVRTLADPDAEWPHGRVLRDRTLVRADEDLATRLGIQTGQSVHQARTELLDPDARPAGLETAWHRGRRRAHASYRCTVGVRRMTHEEADLLGLAVGTLALLLQRTRFDEIGAPVQAVDLVLPADRWSVALP